jgi:hypothetical protein
MNGNQPIMNSDKKITRNTNGNLSTIEMLLFFSSIFYFLSIVQYYYVEKRTFFVEEKYSVNANWSPWFSISIVTIFICLFFIALIRVLTLKFRTKWSRDVFSNLIRAVSDGSGFSQWEINFNSLHSLRVRTKIGYTFIVLSLILFPLLFIYILFWSSARNPVNIFRIIIFSIHLVFIFTMGVLNILNGIEPEITRRFAHWKISEKKSAILLSVNIDGGCCEINGKIYFLELERDREKRVEKLFIDKNTENISEKIYI